MSDSPLDEIGSVHQDIHHVVVSDQQIADRVDELAADIAACYEGMELTIMAVLTGSLIFLADLIRKMPVRMRLDLVSISSYPGDSTVSRGPRWLLPISADLRGRHVLILDDILDTGRTLDAMKSAIAGMGPASLKTCVLLRKDRPDVSDRFEPDFVGFDIANEFVVGYGLDFDYIYRNLPQICVLNEHAQGESP